jgi:hypothetical protein
MEIGTDGTGGEVVLVTLGANTGSLQLTANVTASNALFTNNVTIGGRLTANEYYVTTVSASVLQTSGSTRFGNTSDDKHEFTGSVWLDTFLYLENIPAVSSDTYLVIDASSENRIGYKTVPLGAQGPQGATGPQGAFGSNGTSGTSATSGTSGTSGTNGSSGTAGSNGTSGAQGNQGDTGAQGTQGFQGNQGPQGNQGTQGVQGTQGTQGVQGTQGNQ